jgi:quercetin dioxygenase-like cupin family protein
MMNISLRNLQLFRFRGFTAKKILLPALLGIAASAIATPPFGFYVNEILAKGLAQSNINEHIQVVRNQDGTVNPWSAEVHTQGLTDTYQQHLVLIPSGYSGWHTHPGILIATVKSGSIDFYDANCQKRTVNAGEVYFENGHVHGIYNSGGVDADLYISYLLKHDGLRRTEADAPACAASTPIP